MAIAPLRNRPLALSPRTSPPLKSEPLRSPEHGLVVMKPSSHSERLLRTVIQSRRNGSPTMVTPRRSIMSLRWLNSFSTKPAFSPTPMLGRCRPINSHNCGRFPRLKARWLSRCVVILNVTVVLPIKLLNAASQRSNRRANSPFLSLPEYSSASGKIVKIASRRSKR